MERLTKKQKEVYDIIIKDDKISLQGIAKKLGGLVTRQAILERIVLMAKKGYLTNNEGKYRPTASGVDKMLKDGGETKYTYYENR